MNIGTILKVLGTVIAIVATISESVRDRWVYRSIIGILQEIIPMILHLMVVIIKYVTIFDVRNLWYMKFCSNDFNGIYADMYEQLGEELVREIYKHYRGQQVTFPMRIYSKEYIIRYISEKYDGNNLKEVARELGYSERWVKTLIDNNLKK